MVRKLVDDQQLDAGRVSGAVVYDRIKRSNSTLSRRPKKLLEDSIDRVLEVIKGDFLGDDSESIDGDFEGLEVQEEPPPVGYG